MVHGIPKTPVDVYLDGKLALNDFVFGTVTKPIALPRLVLGGHPFPCGLVDVVAHPLDHRQGDSRRDAAIVANLTATGAATLNVFGDPTSPLPMGDARVIVRHVADAPGVDVYAGQHQGRLRPEEPAKATLVIPAGKVTVRVDVTSTTTTVIGPATSTSRPAQPRSSTPSAAPQERPLRSRCRATAS